MNTNARFLKEAQELEARWEKMGFLEKMSKWNTTGVLRRSFHEKKII